MHARRQVRLLRDSAPDHISGVGGLHLGQHLRANGRAEPVGSDEQIAPRRRAIGKRYSYPVSFTDIAQRMPSEMMRAIGQQRTQQLVQPRPRSDDLRIGHLGDAVPGQIKGHPLAHLDAQVIDGCTHGLQCRDQLRVGHNPGAASRQFNVRAFEHLHGPAPRAQWPQRPTDRQSIRPQSVHVRPLPPFAIPKRRNLS